MTNHPTRAALEGFLGSRLSSGENQAVLAHLITGCPRCRAEMEPLATAMLLPGVDEAKVDPELEDSYDAAITAAGVTALERVRQIEREREEAKRAPLDASPEEEELWTWGACEALLERSHSLRLDDPEGMLRFANLAVMAAEKIDSDGYGQAPVADLQARSWAALANAYRVATDFPQAAAAMERALAHRARGTGDPLLLARISDLAASLACGERRFSEAFRMLDLSFSLYQAFGDSHDAGRVLVMKGLFLGYAGESEQGIAHLALGLEMVDRDRDPQLAFQALHNILLLQLDAGDLQSVASSVARARPLYERYAGRVERIKLEVIFGRLAAGFGDLERAEECWARAWRSFEEIGLGLYSAQALLEVANIRVQEGRTEEAVSLTGDLVRGFQALGVEREATASLLLLKAALERAQSERALEVIGNLAGLLRQVESSARPHIGADVS